MERKFSKESFADFLKVALPSYKGDVDFLYELSEAAFGAIPTLSSQSPVLARFAYSPAKIIFYLVGEHTFYLQTHPDKKEAELKDDPSYASFIVSFALDKYYTNEHLSYSEGSLLSPYMPEVSTLSLYLNFILGTLRGQKKGDPKETLFVDILSKGLSMARCILELLVGGYETEAFSTWRTLHENECILLALVGAGEKAVQSYLRHLQYALAFRGAIKSKEETDKVFLEIKDEMHAHGLKSKDMKRFIEYGWLYDIEGVEATEGFKLNFRDGVERIAGLHSYSKVYEMSSEIAHSSPLLIYSRKSYFLLITLLSLYESFFRLEKIFASLYLATASPEAKRRYESLRKAYYGEIVASYEKTKKRFVALPSKEKAPR